jgi:UDP-N-acetylmuramoylalanine--D-glutamate ligase
LDWHETAEHYSTSKRVLREAVTADRFVAPIADDDIAAEVADDAWWANSVQLDPREHAQLRKAISLRLPGEHQVRNAVCALRAASIHLEQRPERRLELMLSMAGALSDFRGLPHRLHPAGVVRGVRVFDDSKATTPEATLRAVRSFDNAARVHLIAGGYDKGADLSAIKALGDELAGLYAIGATASSLSGGQHAMQCETLGIAVNEAATRARDGDVLLLSPGCASWDQFTNYEERGREFVAAAHRVLGSAHS